MSTSTMPGSYVERGIQIINQVASRWQDTAQDQSLVFDRQLQYTKGVLEAVPEEHLVEHGNVHRELYRVIRATKALLDSTTDWSIKTDEYFMENLFDLQWWTCVVALQVGKGQLLDPQTYLSLQVQLEELAAIQLRDVDYILKNEPHAGLINLVRRETSWRRQRHLPSYQLQALLIQREGSFTRRLMFPWNEPVREDVEVDVDPAVVENLNSINLNSFRSVPSFGGESSGTGRDPMEILYSLNVHSIADDHQPECSAPVSDVSQRTFLKNYPDDSGWQGSRATLPDRDRDRVGKHPAAATSWIPAHINPESPNMFYEAHLPEPKRRMVFEDGIKSVHDKNRELHLDVVLTEIRDRDDRVSHGGVFNVVEPVEIFRAEQRGLSTQDHITIDLFQDMLGVSHKGWVIRTSFSGEECALKRVDISTTDLYDDTNVRPPDLARLWHPHIVDLMHYWTEHSYLFLVMELMDGDLAELIARKGLDKTKSPFSLVEAVDIMLQIAKGMVYMHDMGVTHPHLKCASVLLKADTTCDPNQIDHYYVVKLGGFGNSMKCDPEDRSRDVYLFGLTCLELLTGNLQSEDSIQHHIPERTPPTMRYCIENCLSAALTFSEVVILLLLTQLQMLEGKEGEETHRNKILVKSNISLGGCAVNFSSVEEISTLRSHRVHQLYPEVGDPDPVSSKAGVTFVLFHGFPKGSEEWKTTWMTRDSKEIWPQTWLPQDLGGMNVRVLSVSYNDIDPNEEMADHLGEDLVKSLICSSPGNAIDPHHSIVLVGHGYGGLVIKNLIFQTYNHVCEHMLKRVGEEDDIKQRGKEWWEAFTFLKNLRGIVFFSVPHSTVEGTREFEHYIMACSKSRVLRRSALLKGLTKDMEAFSQKMKQLSVDFQARVPKRTVILSFVEGKAKKVQISGNSKLRPVRWISEEIEEDNHFEICRPHSKEHVGYKKLLYCLKKDMIPLTKMVGSDNVNASLGFAFGVAFGGVMTLVNKMIEGLKFVYHCNEQCTTLREYLEMITPMVLNIFDECESEEPLQKWLDVFQKCVEDAQNILEKCQDNSSWEKAMEVKYGLQILELKKKIIEILRFSPLTHLGIKSKSYVDPCVMAQEVPYKIFGMEDHFKRIKSTTIDGNASKSSKCVGIQGMGGSGKTLLAQMVNNDEEVQKSFGGTSIFWITVGRGAWIPYLYVQMREYLNVHNSSETSLEDQRTHLMNEFSKRRILLILDDVWDNLHDFKGMVYWLNIATGLGSVTMLTTRSLPILRCLKASVEVILLLSEEHSWELFCIHAFGINGLPLNQELVGLVKDVCKECKHLPLALKVIGTTMKCKDERTEWRSLLRDLQKLNAMHEKDVEKQLFLRLQISYDQLDEPTKICFLYFAAYPKDWEIPQEELFHMWIAEDLFGDDLNEKDAMIKAHVALNELRRRALIEDCKNNCVKMHNILRDLAIHVTKKGDEIARETLFEPEIKMFEQFPSAWLGSPLKVKRVSLGGKIINRYPGNFIALQLRVCLLNPSFDGHTSHYLFSTHENCIIEDSFFTNVTNIRYLNMRSNVYMKTIPRTIGTLRCLRHLNLNNCSRLEELPEIGGLGSLQHLNLSECIALKELPNSIGGLGSLQHLNLRGCGALKELPESIGGLECLQYLDLNYCKALKKIPKSIEGLGSLQHPNLESCRVQKKLPESFGGLPKGLGGLTCLKKFYMGDCKALEEFPSGVCMQVALEELDFHGCKSLKKIPEGLKGLTCLKKLGMWECEALEEFPSGVGTLVALEELYFHGCKSLKKISEGLAGLMFLKKFYMWQCEALEEFPSGACTFMALEELDFGGCKSLKKIPEGLRSLTCLKKLGMWDCETLEEFPSGVCNLVALEELNFCGCKSLKKIPEGLMGLTCLKKLYMWNCKALEEFPLGVCTLVALEELYFHGCKSLKKIPEGLRGLMSLKKLYMWQCEALEEFPFGVCTLVTLEELGFGGCKSLKKIPEGLRGLTCLKELGMWECEALEKFPCGVCMLVALEELNFRGCRSLKKIPEGLKGLICLKKLSMWDCQALEEFPSGVCTLVTLEELGFGGCKTLKRIPEGLRGLTCLKKLYMWECEALEEFPSGTCMLMSLEELDFHGCKSLKNIPEGLGGLISLRKLYMWGCEALEEFPSGVSTLMALEELYFHGCKSLKKIPEKLMDLTCLKNFSMQESEALEEFPSGACTHLSLEELHVHGCKSLKKIPESFGKAAGEDWRFWVPSAP